MGMDASDRNPTALQGEYFYASIRQWSLLVEVITTLCPQETSACKGWKTENVDGLNAAQALALAKALERKLRSGEVAFALCDPTIIGKARSSAMASIEALLRSRGAETLHHEAIFDENFGPTSPHSRERQVASQFGASLTKTSWRSLSHLRDGTVLMLAQCDPWLVEVHT